MKWQRGRFPCADEKINQKHCVVSDFQQNLEAPVITTTDMTEKDIGGGGGAVDACLSASAHAKNGESVFCQSHSIHPHPSPSFPPPVEIIKRL
jgi:hypothetical protein